MTEMTSVGFPKDISSEELRDRLKLAVQNRQQVDDYIKAVAEELRKRTNA